MHDGAELAITRYVVPTSHLPPPTSHSPFHFPQRGATLTSVTMTVRLQDETRKAAKIRMSRSCPPLPLSGGSESLTCL